MEFIKDIILVDNASHCFAFHIDNGYPILPFYDDKDDLEMVHLYWFLVELHQCDDVRNILKCRFMMRKFLRSEIANMIPDVVEYAVQEISDEEMKFIENSLKHTKNEDKSNNDSIKINDSDKIQGQDQEQGQLSEESGFLDDFYQFIIGVET